MSHFAKIEVKFFDAQALVAALVAVGVPREHIEVNAQPQPVYDYQGQPTSYLYKDHHEQYFAKGDIGHVFIRRKFLPEAHNDICFNTDKQHSCALICDYARQRSGYNDKWLGKVTQEYAAELAKKHYAAMGKQVVRVNENNMVRLYVKA
jgi:hypothetical protein